MSPYRSTSAPGWAAKPLSASCSAQASSLYVPCDAKARLCLRQSLHGCAGRRLIGGLICGSVCRRLSSSNGLGLLTNDNQTENVHYIILNKRTARPKTASTCISLRIRRQKCMQSQSTYSGGSLVRRSREDRGCRLAWLVWFCFNHISESNCFYWKIRFNARPKTREKWLLFILI